MMMSCLGSRVAVPHIRFENTSCGRRIFKYGEKNLHFRKYPAACRWSNMVQKRYVWTHIFLKYGEKNVCFRKYVATCGRGLCKFIRTSEQENINMY